MGITLTSDLRRCSSPPLFSSLTLFFFFFFLFRYVLDFVQELKDTLEILLGESGEMCTKLFRDVINRPKFADQNSLA